MDANSILASLPGWITSLTSLFAANPVVGAVVSVLVLILGGGIAYWMKSQAADVAKSETDKRQDADLTKVVQETNQVAKPADQAADDIDAIRKAKAAEAAASAPKTP